MMTIKDIDYTNDRIRKKEKKEENIKEQKVYQELIKKFNKKAKELDSPYRVNIKHNYPHLTKIINNKILFWNYKEMEEITQIIYLNNENYFVFYGGLSFKIFNDIEKILNNIDIKFEVKLKSGKIPAKYKILEELK